MDCYALRTRIEQEALALAKARCESAKVFSIGAIDLDPKHLAIWITTESDAQRDALAADAALKAALMGVLHTVSYPNARGQENQRDLLAPIDHVQLPDYDPRRYDDGLHEVILTGPPLTVDAAEIFRRCVEQARQLMQPEEGGRDWSVSEEGLNGIMNPTYWGHNPTTSPIPELYGASFVVRSAPPAA